MSRPHTKAGVTTDLRTTPLTADQVESAIARDIVAKKSAGLRLPGPPDASTFAPSATYTGEVHVDRFVIGYKAVQLPNRVDVSTYYLKAPRTDAR